jgi:hypothetical protein
MAMRLDEGGEKESKSRRSLWDGVRDRLTSEVSGARTSAQPSLDPLDSSLRRELYKAAR